MRLSRLRQKLSSNSLRVSLNNLDKFIPTNSGDEGLAITSQPLSSTENVGDTATLTIGVSGGTPAIRWQRKDNGSLGWVTVQESTSTSYTTGVLNEFDDGVQYRVIVDPGGENLTSDTATLTVEFENEVFFADFLSGTDSFSAGTRTSFNGPYQTDGVLAIASGDSSERSFTEITSGKVKTDIWVYANDATNGSSTNLNTYIYLLPPSVSVASANSLTFLSINRLSTASATSEFWFLQTRDGGSFIDVFEAVGRYQWIKLSVVVDLDNDTFDLYLNDTLISKDLDCPNAGASGLSRVVLVGGSTAPTTYFDAIRVQSSYTDPTETTLVEQDFTAGSGDIADSKPTTYRTLHAQKWNVPENTTTFATLDLNSSGAANNVASRSGFGSQAGLADGIVEAEFRTSVSGNIYFGIQFRLWDWINHGSAALFRVYGAGSNTASLFMPDAAGLNGTAGSISLTPSANSTYTLRVEKRGRVFTCSYKNAAIDSGSYVTAFTFTADDSGVGGRGMLAEEIFGPYLDSNLGDNDNYCTNIRFTGFKPIEKTISVGHYEAVLGPGTVRELYSSGYDDPEANLFWSRGIQFGHRSRADMGNRWTYWSTIAESENVCSYRQASSGLTEYQVLSSTDCYATFLRRGIWVLDNLTAKGNTENFAPDTDFNGPLWVGSYRVCGPTGSGSLLSDLAYHDWRNDVPNSEMPIGFQRVTNDGANDVRLTKIGLNVSGLTGAVQDSVQKYRGAGEPISHAITRPSANMVHNTTYEMARCILLESGESSLSDTVLTELRDDLDTPATWAVTSGSVKTDADGDADADGFNERHGWYELTVAENQVEVTNDSTKRIQPVFRIHSMTALPTVVNVNGTNLVEDTDYWLDDLGSNQYLIQFADDLAADATLFVTSGSSTLLRGLAAFWPLDEASGDPQDYLSNADLTEVGTLGSVAGHLGDARDFGGSDYGRTAKANVPNLYGGGDFTISGWINPDATATTQIASVYGAPGNRSWLLQLGSTWRLLASTDGTATSNTGFIGSTVSTGTYLHWLLQWDESANEFELFVNNVSIGTLSPPGTGLFDSTHDFNLGSRENGTGNFDGKMDATGVWSRLLTSDERTALYAAGVGVEAPF